MRKKISNQVFRKKYVKRQNKRNLTKIFTIEDLQVSK